MVYSKRVQLGGSILISQLSGGLIKGMDPIISFFDNDDGHKAYHKWVKGLGHWDSLWDEDYQRWIVATIDLMGPITKDPFGKVVNNDKPGMVEMRAVHKT